MNSGEKILISRRAAFSISKYLIRHLPRCSSCVGIYRYFLDWNSPITFVLYRPQLFCLLLFASKGSSCVYTYIAGYITSYSAVHYSSHQSVFLFLCWWNKKMKMKTELFEDDSVTIIMCFSLSAFYDNTSSKWPLIAVASLNSWGVRADRTHLLRLQSETSVPRGGGGGRVLPYTGYMGTCRGIGYGFWMFSILK